MLSPSFHQGRFVMWQLGGEQRECPPAVGLVCVGIWVIIDSMLLIKVLKRVHNCTLSLLFGNRFLFCVPSIQRKLNCSGKTFTCSTLDLNFERGREKGGVRDTERESED